MILNSRKKLTNFANKMKKIDLELLKVITSSARAAELECFVYVANVYTAKTELSKLFNIEVIGEFPFVQILYVKGAPDTIFALSRHDNVKFVSSLSHVSALVNVSKKALNFKDNLTGKGVTIAYIDTGIFPHVDFVLGNNRILKFVDLIGNSEVAYDDNGHGTFVSGVGSGSGLLSGHKYKGFAPDSGIISIKALNRNGEASASKILEAMQWIYSNHKQFNIKVVCMSFGSEPLGFNDPIMQGAEMLWKSGVLVVAAAGNSGPDYETVKSPGISPKIVTVGGINDNRTVEDDISDKMFEIASFSSRGPALRRHKPDLVAPGVDIVSCSRDEKGYTKLSGTSVSTPMIAGISACAFERNPNLTPDQVKKRLLWACRPITYNKNFEGFGLLDAGKFLNSF